MVPKEILKRFSVKRLASFTQGPRLSHTNKAENENFWHTATSWSGSVSPIIASRVFFAVAFSLLVTIAEQLFPALSIPVTPFEYSGAALGILLVLRVNIGLDRWWEARKLWGSINTQSVNLALIGYGYIEKRGSESSNFLKWVAVWPHIIKESLRDELSLYDAERILGPELTGEIRNAAHMPTFVAARIVTILRDLRKMGLDDFAFQQAESERARILDAVGACERIRNMPIPFVLAIKTRRFVALFLILLPIALVDRAGWLTPLVVALAAYPLFSLEEIGFQLQNPFSLDRLSHHPMDSICQKIEKNVLGLEDSICK